MADKKKSGKGFRMPHTLVLMYLLVAIVLLLAWILPSGEFQRVKKTVAGVERSVTVPGTFQKVEKPRVGPESLLTAPIRGFQDGILIISLIFIIGGAFAVIQETGAIDLAIRRMARSFSRHPASQKLVIPVLMTIFSLGGAIFGMSEETIPFVLIFIPLARSLGYDSIVGIAIPFVGAAAGFAAAFFNPFTVGIAQGLTDIPLYSGLGYRLISWVLGTIVVIVYVMHYAAKVKRDPESSPVADIDRERTDAAVIEEETPSKWNWGHRLVLLILLAGIGLLVYGILVKHWYILEITALFLGMGLLAGICARLHSGVIARSFVQGARDMMNVAFVIACGRALLLIAQDGKILDTILHYSAQAIAAFPRVVTAQIMFLVQSGINFFIHSGTAQASLTMPIMGPLSDLVGITRQTTVYAFQLCEFVNPILPTSAVTMGILGMAKVPWEKWARWFLPLMILLVLLSLILLIPPVLMNWQ